MPRLKQNLSLTVKACNVNLVQLCNRPETERNQAHQNIPLNLSSFGGLIFSVTWLLAVECDYLSGFLVLTWVWPCCLVTPQSLVQTLVRFNLVRVSPPSSSPPSIPRLKFHARPPGSSSVRHYSGHKDLQRMLLVNTVEPRPSAVSPQQHVKYVLPL